MTKPDLNPVLAVGDVHGQIDKLKSTVEPYKGSGREIIFLGDLIDRAATPGGDLAVLNYVKDLQDNADAYGLAGVTALCGNHEQYLLGLKTNFVDQQYRRWLANGGDPQFFADADPYLAWIDSFPLYVVRGKYLFVHAGVKPGVRLKKQKRRDLLWIRNEFLETQDHGLPFTVVHGHSVIGFSDMVKSPINRINVDFGACFGSDLYAVEIDPDEDFFCYSTNGQVVNADDIAIDWAAA